MVISKIKSAADVYLSGNSTVLNSLYTDKAYVLIKVSDLISEGLIDKNLTDPTTGTAIADDATVMASLDETGTIKYDYPADPANEDYLKVLNVYLEQNEKVDCFTGANGVGYVKGESLTNITTTNEDNHNVTCDLSSLDVKMPGTYKIKYTYKLTNGVTKETTRKFIVQKPVSISLLGKTTDNNPVVSGKWSTKEFTITSNPDRAANIVYSWKNKNSSESSINISNNTNEQITLDYNVYYINATTKTKDTFAYSGSVTFDAKLELATSTFTAPTVTKNNNWSNTAVTITANVSNATSIFSGIKEYYYCLSATTCTPNTLIANNAASINFAVSTLGENKVFVYYKTEAGNTSNLGEGLVKFDNEAPVCTGGNVSSVLSATCTDQYSGIKEYDYGYTTNNNTPSSWTTSNGITYPGCGSTYYYFAKATDNAENESNIVSIGSQSGGSCCYGCDCYGTCYVDTTPTVSAPACDAACKILNTADYWQTSCPGCSQETFTNKIAKDGIDVGGGTIIHSYQDVKDIRTAGGLTTNAKEDCTVNVTCK